MADNVLSLIIRAKNEAEATVRNVSKSLDGLGDSAGKAHGRVTLMQGAVAGIAAGATMAAIGAVQGAVSSLGMAFESVVKGAMDDERSVARLGIVLRDNIPAWKGNTDAIEAAVHARVGLGFADEALRDSIGTLVTRTGDVTKALGLQTLAMDIARFKGVSLEAATTAVGRAYSGSATALQRMGIAVTAGATGAEALRQATAALAGQAESYATTTLGKVEVAQARFSESMDDLGARALPVVAGAASNLTTVIEVLSGAFGGGADEAADYGMELDILDTGLSVLTFGMSRAFAETMNLAQSQKVAEANAVAYAASIDGDRVALGMLEGATRAATASDYAQIDAFVVSSHAADERADAERALTGAILGRLAADAAAVGAQATIASLIATERAEGRTAADLTAEYKNNAAAAQKVRDATAAAAAAANAHTGAMGRTTSAAASLTSAADKLAAKVRDQLAASFDRFKTAALAAMDAVHTKKLRAIDDAQKLADAEYKAARAAIQGPVDAARATLDAARAARDLADAQRAVNEAMATGDQAAVESAQRRLGDMMADAEIAAMQKAADAKTLDLEAAKTIADQKRKDDAAAEEERYAAQKVAFEKDLKALETALAGLEEKYKGKTKELIAAMKGYNADFTKLGKSMGVSYSTGAVEGLDTLIPKIAAKVKELLAADAKAEAEKEDPQGDIPTPKPKPPGLAAGGPVSAWSPYIVGERGPELFVPGTAGRIIPNGGGGGMSLNVTVQGAAVFDPLGIGAQQLAAAMLPAIRREFARQGTSL